MICVRFAVSADKGDISIYFVGAIRTHIPDVSGAARPRTPRFTISHLDALRAAVRIEAYGLYAQK